MPTRVLRDGPAGPADGPDPPGGPHTAALPDRARPLQMWRRGRPSRDSAGVEGPSPIQLLDRLRRSIRTLPLQPQHRTGLCSLDGTVRGPLPPEPGADGRRRGPGFLSHLAVEGHVSAATRTRPWPPSLPVPARARREDGGRRGASRRRGRSGCLRAVAGEVTRARTHERRARLVCGLLYGTGMRLTECLSLRSRTSTSTAAP